MNTNMSRTATFTTPEADEVKLDFRQDFGPTHALNGQPAVVYYSRADYQKRQAKHGQLTYPEPTPCK
jgi:hypothetical protein